MDDVHHRNGRPAVIAGAESTDTAALPVLQAGGFGASVDAFAWEPDPDTNPPRMRLWLLSLLGSQQALKALWAQLIKGETVTLSTDAGRAHFCTLAQQGSRGWRFFKASLPAVGAYHGVLVPEIALFSAEQADFLLLRRDADDVAMLHYRFLNRRVNLPLHPTWAGWLWERARRTGEAWPLESRAEAYRCVPDGDALAVDLTEAIGHGLLGLTDEDVCQPTRRNGPGRHWKRTGVARLESVAQAGYYPTPPRIVAAITRHLGRPATDARRVVRLLDPCAGTGAAAASLTQASGAESFGIELNEERAAAARDRLDHVLCTSAFSVRLANGAFSCLFLNSPYDYDDESRRLEHAFLTSLTRALCPGGVLILLIPQPRLAVSARYLASHYTGFQAFRFPDPEYLAFRQMVLFAIRRPKATPDPAVQANLEAWSHGELSPLPDTPAGPPVFVPSLPVGDVLFASLTLDPLQAAEEARRRGVWVQPDLVEQLWPADERPVRPLMPLRKGHLALLVAAGMLNNCVLNQDDRRVLVKGRTYKELVRVESGDEDVDVQREVLRTSIAVLDLTTGALEIVDEHGEARMDSAGRAA